VAGPVQRKFFALASSFPDSVLAAESSFADGAQNVLHANPASFGLRLALGWADNPPNGFCDFLEPANLCHARLLPLVLPIPQSLMAGPHPLGEFLLVQASYPADLQNQIGNAGVNLTRIVAEEG